MHNTLWIHIKLALPEARRSQVTIRHPREKYQDAVADPVPRSAGNTHAHSVHLAARFRYIDGLSRSALMSCGYRQLVVGPDVLMVGIPGRPHPRDMPGNNHLGVIGQLVK